MFTLSYTIILSLIESRSTPELHWLSRRAALTSLAFANGAQTCTLVPLPNTPTNIPKHPGPSALETKALQAASRGAGTVPQIVSCINDGVRCNA